MNKIYNFLIAISFICFSYETCAIGGNNTIIQCNGKNRKVSYENLKTSLYEIRNILINTNLFKKELTIKDTLSIDNLTSELKFLILNGFSKDNINNLKRKDKKKLEIHNYPKKAIEFISCLETLRIFIIRNDNHKVYCKTIKPSHIFDSQNIYDSLAWRLEKDKNILFLELSDSLILQSIKNNQMYRSYDLLKERIEKGEQIVKNFNECLIQFVEKLNLEVEKINDELKSNQQLFIKAKSNFRTEFIEKRKSCLEKRTELLNIGTTLFQNLK